MSLVETAGPRRGSLLRLVRSELRLVLGRRRNQVLLAGLALVPLLLGTVLFLSQDTALQGQGPGFVGRVTSNGLFLVVASLFVCLPFLLPLTIGIASGDAIAGEASAGTLRYLLTVPVARGRLLAVKAVGALTFAAAAGTSSCSSGCRWSRCCSAPSCSSRRTPPWTGRARGSSGG